LTILADPNAAGFYERNGAARGSTNSLFKFSVSGGISGRERDDAGADRRGALGRGCPAVCCCSMSYEIMRDRAHCPSLSAVSAR